MADISHTIAPTRTAHDNSIYFYIYSVYFIRVKCVDMVLLHNKTMSLEKSHLIS